MKVDPSVQNRGCFKAKWRGRWQDASGKISSSVLHPAWLACALLLGAAAAEAATFTVNTTNDTADADVGDGICADINGNCSVRAAIMQANFTNVIGPSNTIIIPAGVFKLTRPGNEDGDILGDLDITATMSIQGAGSALTIIDGNGAVTGDRVIQIFSTAPETSLSGLTIRNGKRTNTFDEGGGLYWDGSGGGQLNLSDVIIESNAAPYGAGLFLNYSAFGDIVEMDHFIVRANTATAAGGGMCVIFNDYPGFDLAHSQVYGNTAFQGGGLYFQASTPPSGLQFVRIETTDISSNTAGHGGGFDNDQLGPYATVLLNCNLRNNTAAFLGGAIENYGTLAISNTTLNANSTGNMGGGIYTEGGTVTIASSTLSGNLVTNGSGGAIYNNVNFQNAGGALNLFNSTIASNSAASGFGGGITNHNGTVIARDIIIAGNSAQNAGSGPDFAGVLVSASSGYDLFGNSGGLIFSGAPPLACVFNVNPLLGPLQDNGGPTLTHALLPGSPAIDAGRSIGVTTDQRGAPRQVDDPSIPNANPGDGSDLGAVESGKARLAIQKAGNAAVLSWPYYYGGYSVQSATNLSFPNSWTIEAGSPVVSSNLYVFTNSPISGNKFYRLKGN